MIKIIGNIILLGTSHVSKQSTLEIKQAINKYNPEVVGIELDYDRFKSLFSNSKNKKNINFKSLVKEFGLSGAIFTLVAGHFQKKIGKKMKIEPGIDMKTAYLESRKKKIPTSLIDLNIKHTMRKISNINTFKKIGLIFKLIFTSLNPKNAKKYQFDIKKGVPSEKTIIQIFNFLKKEFPQIYKILIVDRNRFMVKKLLSLRQRHSEGYILAVVGAGHLPGMYELLKKEIKEDSHTTVDRTITLTYKKFNN
jgi:pheromone shutdown-related protein TraB